MGWLEHKIPPPVIGVLCALLMWGISMQTPVIAWWGALAQAITGLLVLLGLFLDSGGLLSFIRSKTTINPINIEKASALVTGGVYRFTRNPMYLGMAFLLTALAIWLQTPLAFVGPVLFVGYITRFQIIPEERALQKLFGQEYLDYSQRVRRWL
jgi:protein-S-isoprenylcysteine O-methyltransferase Ste14